MICNNGGRGSSAILRSCTGQHHSAPLSMKLSICLFFCLIWLNNIVAGNASTAITDHTNYNVGSPVLVRLGSGTNGTASIRYAGEAKPIESNIHLNGAEYQRLWNIPWNAKTGRYEVYLALQDGKT